MFTRKRRELQEELRTHLEMATRDRIARGEAPADAAAAARRELGNVLTVSEVTRETWGWMRIERLIQDVRYALRLLRRSPVFTTVAVLSLATGIGATAAIFQIVNAVRLRPLPVPNPQQLVEIAPITMDGARGNFASWRAAITNPIWERIRGMQAGLAGTLAWAPASFDLASGGESRPARGLWVSGEFFDVLGVQPLHGRLFTRADDRRGCPARAVLSHGFWRRELGADPAAVGRTLSIGSVPVEIVGIAPAAFFGMEVGRTFDVAVPLCAEPALTPASTRLDSGTDWWLVVMGRIRPGVSYEELNAELRAASPGIFRETLAPGYPAVSVNKYLAMTLHAQPAATGVSYLREQYAAPLGLLLALGGTVLLIACANLANLMLARGSTRAREIAIQLGLGASRGRVVRQLLTESALLSIAGAALGYAIAGMLGGALVAFVDGGGGEIALDLRADARVIALVAALAVASTVVFGLLPALRATSLRPAALMKDAGRGLTASRRDTGWRRALAGTQVAFALVLLCGALLFARTLRNLGAVHPGFTTQGIVMVDADLARAEIPDERRTAGIQRLVERLRAVPGVDAAAATSVMPLSGDVWAGDLLIDTATGPATVNARLSRIGPGYFDTFRIRLLAGRDFDAARDSPTTPRVAIVNRSLAAMLGGAGAVGRQFTMQASPWQPATTYEIVGIAGDAKYVSLRESDAPSAYFPLSQASRTGRWTLIAVRTGVEPQVITPALLSATRETDPNIAVSFTVLERFVQRTLTRERLLATLSMFFGGVAAALAMIGLYGVIAYSVTRRTNEIGIRMALGASRTDVLAMVLREAIWLVASGLAIGVALTLVTAKTVESFLFGLEPRDPLSIAIAALGLSAVTMLASLIPARTASRIDPNLAIRAG